MEQLRARRDMGDVYRGRLAPSSTGLLHLGHARTFWVATQRARAAGGALVLRDEDLDLQRWRLEFSQALVEDLHWLGLRWDEGPDVGGAYGPYTQSARREGYLAAWRKLVERGWVYPCVCSRKELRVPAGARQDGGAGEVDEEDDELLYPGTCRPRGGSLIAERGWARKVAETAAVSPMGAAWNTVPSPTGVNWRFRVPDGETICFRDGNYGERCYVAGRDFGDFLVWRRDDVAAYQLACVVDDAAMRITEVVRGADLLRSTARQLLLYRGLGLTPPRWWHCPLVLDDEGRRLAKKTGASSIRSLREAGCSPAEVLAMAAVAPGGDRKGPG